MSDPGRRSRTAELVALAQATDANGQVDLTAYEAQRLILQNQAIDGLDARGLVDDLVRSPAYATQAGRDQVQPLLSAISARLPPADANRFAAVLDAANVGESWLERNFEHYVEEPVFSAATQAGQAIDQGLSWTDRQISDNLVATRRWANSLADAPQNNWLERAAGRVVAEGAGQVQERYGAMKGATQHGLQMLGDTVDLAKFANRFATDRDFRNLMIGAAGVYASDVAHDPSKPVTDIQNAARRAWNEWEQGLEQATRDGREREYLGGTQGAAGIEIIATFLPVSHVTKLGRVARALDGANDLAPVGRTAGNVEGRVAGELAEQVVDLAEGATRAQARGGVEKGAGDLAFSGLAGIKRSQGELRELVDGLRKSGDLDGLLRSGALAPRELNYLARTDLSAFDGDVSFHQALNAHVGYRQLSQLSDPVVGDIGEAVVAHDLAKRGYRDLVPIQNNSGHGNDLAGINPHTGRWEVVEVKASVQGIARNQSGEPLGIITDRLRLADGAKGLWAPKNMWEEQAQSTARRVLKEAEDPITGKLDIDPKWARVNIERDAATGELKATPDIQDWKSPAQRRSERTQQQGEVEPVTPIPKQAALDAEAASVVALPSGFAPAMKCSTDLRDPHHPGHDAFARTLSEVHNAETTRGIAHGSHSERVAAALMLEAIRNGHGITNVEIGREGRIVGLERGSMMVPAKQVSIDSNQALSMSMEQYAAQWAQTRSPHYARQAPDAERTPEQGHALGQLSPRDQAMFARIREGVPPHITDDVVASAMLQAKRDGITGSEQIGGVALSGDRLWIAGTIPGFRTAVDVSAQAPSLQETAQQTQVFNQQREQQLAMEASQREQQQAQGRGFSV
jgi:hypothetical protein